ncbi:MAG: ABC transporter ATP-binding protein [Acidimicrobiaceae bacterium]|nr:ABC transporter ATP-binding protein [Acidimicrobiaceae bacterium]
MSAAETLLSVEDLEAGYGTSRVLEGLTFSMGTEAVCIVGRNGMGKSTLCKTIMGLVTPTAGTITFSGRRIDGLAPEKVARSGIAYVPQGRRLFPSLTVEEHLAMLAPESKGKRWTPAAVYELFPRLAERRSNGGAELSGGEQQMLAVGRALLLNTPLIVMDEPSEGLAPSIVDDLIDVVHRLVSEGVALLVVEQNLRAATAMSPRQLVMTSGRIEVELTASELLESTELQSTYLGVDA